MITPMYTSPLLVEMISDGRTLKMSRSVDPAVNVVV